MNRYFSYLNSAVKIITHYKGNEPFSSFLKKYFSLNKKYGSKDRKQIGHLCYCYFRLGKAVTHLDGNSRVILGLFFSSNAEGEMLGTLLPAMNVHAGKTIAEKIKLLKDSTLSIPGIEVDWNDFIGLNLFIR